MNRLAACLTVLLGLQGCVMQHQAQVIDGQVALSLYAPQAKKVQFASSLDRYAVQEISAMQGEAWVIRGLPNREFQYFYLVDGRFFVPECRYRQEDDLGTTNCRYMP